MGHESPTLLNAERWKYSISFVSPQWLTWSVDDDDDDDNYDNYDDGNDYADFESVWVGYHDCDDYMSPRQQQSSDSPAGLL